MKSKIIGKNIRTARMAVNITQENLSGQLGFADPNSIGRIESGIQSISLEKLIDISKIVSSPPSLLVKELLVKDAEYIAGETKQMLEQVMALDSNSKQYFLKLLKYGNPFGSALLTTLMGIRPSAYEMFAVNNIHARIYRSITSRKELAQLMAGRITPGQIGNVERGEKLYELSTFIQACNALKVVPEFFLDDIIRPRLIDDVSKEIYKYLIVSNPADRAFYNETLNLLKK